VADEHDVAAVADDVQDVLGVGVHADLGGGLGGALRQPGERHREDLVALPAQDLRHLVPRPGAEPEAGDQDDVDGLLGCSVGAHAATLAGCR